MHVVVGTEVCVSSICSLCSSAIPSMASGGLRKFSKEWHNSATDLMSIVKWFIWISMHLKCIFLPILTKEQSWYLKWHFFIIIYSFVTFHVFPLLQRCTWFQSTSEKTLTVWLSSLERVPMNLLRDISTSIRQVFEGGGGGVIIEYKSITTHGLVCNWSGTLLHYGKLFKYENRINKLRIK